MVQRTWVKTLPEIVGGLIQLLEDRGRDYDGHDEEWARRCKGIETEGLCIFSEGNEENGPYRLTVLAHTTEDGVDAETPLLKLEIRPGVMWVNEVRRAMAEPVAVA